MAFDRGNARGGLDEIGSAVSEISPGRTEFYFLRADKPILLSVSKTLQYGRFHRFKRERITFTCCQRFGLRGESRPGQKIFEHFPTRLCTERKAVVRTLTRT